MSRGKIKTNEHERLFFITAFRVLFRLTAKETLHEGPKQKKNTEEFIKEKKKKKARKGKGKFLGAWNKMKKKELDKE